MKGGVFNLLEEFVRGAHGEDAWDDVLYADRDLGALVGAASERLGPPPPVIVRAFGRARPRSGDDRRAAVHAPR